MPFGGWSSLLTSDYRMAKPTPDSLFSSALRPDQKKVYPASRSVRSPSSANRVSLRATMGRLYLLSSRAMRAVLLSGLFVCFLSRRVRTFQAPTVIEVTLAFVIFVFRPQKGDSCQPRFAGQEVLGQSFFRSPFPDPSPDWGEQRHPEKSCSVAQGRTRRTIQPSYRSNGHLPKGRLREGRC